MTQIAQWQVASSDGSTDLESQLANLKSKADTAQSTANTNATAISSHDVAIQALKTAAVKGQVPDVVSLPATGNADGDVRFVKSMGQFYYWNATAVSPSWQPLNGGEMRGTAFPTTNLYSGLLFYRTDLELLFIYNGTAKSWVQK